jgi:hypothetical protein
MNNYAAWILVDYWLSFVCYRHFLYYWPQETPPPNLTTIVKPVNQYKYSTSQRHSMINHCDRCITLLGITLLGDTDISFGVFNLFTYFDMPYVRPNSRT